MDDTARARQFEREFFAQFQARAERLVRGRFPADRVRVEPTGDGAEYNRNELSRLKIYDRGALDRLGGSFSQEYVFLRNVLGGWLQRAEMRMRVRSIAPIEALATGKPAGPIGVDELLDLLAPYSLLPRRDQPNVVIVASPTGFTSEALALVKSRKGSPLVLIGGRSDGGWDIEMPAVMKKSPWARLFDFETSDERSRRLMYHLESNAAALDSRGLSVAELSEKVGLPRDQTEVLVRAACRTNPRLMTVVTSGQLTVCRTPLAEEKSAMNFWGRVRKLLRMKPTVAQRVRDLTEQRVRLEQQRHELDSRLAELETQERDAVQRGAQAASDAERRQLAQRLTRVRRDLGRVRSQANIFTQQIDILGTHIHHMTLAEQGRRMDVPAAEELTREAAQAERVLGDLAVSADLARNIEVTGETPMMAEEEAAIMEEFRQVAATQAQRTASSEPASAGRAASTESTRGEKPRTPQPEAS